MSKLFRVLLASSALVLCQGAGATAINGTIRTVDGDGDGKKQELKVARVAFTVTAGTHLLFDSLVSEAQGDLNGDGFITGFDDEMRLFDGATLLLADDDSGLTYGDGSQRPQDAAFYWTFERAGTYLVTLGVHEYSNADALRGYQANKTYQPYYGIEHFGAWRLSLSTFAGSVSDVREITNDVPEPGTLALFAAGLAGAGLLRRRRR